MIIITDKRNCKAITSISLSIFVLISLFLMTTAGAEVVIAFEPSQLIVEENEEFTLNIMIESDVNISGAEIELSYEPEFMEVVSISEGDFFNQGGESTIFSRGIIDNEIGIVTNIYSLIMGNDMLLESGVFATVTLQSMNSSGIADLEMRNVVITNSTGKSLPAIVGNAEIAIGDVELVSRESEMENTGEEESEKTGQNSAIIAIVAMACLYIVRKK